MIDFKILSKPHRYHLDFKSEDLKYPLNVIFTTKNGDIFWEIVVYNAHMWVEGPMARGLDVRIIDSVGDIIFLYNSPSDKFFDIVETKFLNWCESIGYKPKGVVIGSHNGLTGEWVEAYNKDLIGETLLIEPNVNPFLKLVSRYNHDNRFKFKNCVVSESNDIVDFYTDDSGNSELSSLIQSKLSKVVKVKSYNPNDLMSVIPDWIHIDAEGYDAKIILLLNDEILSKVQFIIWEYVHLSEDEKNTIEDKLKRYGFNIIVGDDFNACAHK
jgi:FkbM family methyltransferase